MRAHAGMMEFFALGFDAAFIGEFAQYFFEFRLRRSFFRLESAGDLTRTDLAGLVADEGDDFFLGGEGDLLGLMFDQMNSLRLNALNVVEI